MRKKWTYVVVTVLAFLLPTWGNVVEADEGMTDKVDLYMKAMMEEYQIPGLSVAIVQDGDTLYTNSYGVTAEGSTVSSNTPFFLGSISKSMTALGIVQLVESGQVDLDESIGTYLPWFAAEASFEASSITIRQLLAQTSGYSTYTGMEYSDVGAKDASALKENVRDLSHAKLTRAPGEQHQYSNANYMILGAVLEEVSGQSYADYMEQHVFGPLGMSMAAADEERAVRSGFEQGYQSWFGYPRVSSVPYDNSGASYGYITASIDDMALQFLLQDNDMLLRREHKELLLSPLVQHRPDRAYGFGWRISETDQGETLVWHSGSTPEARAEIFFIPDRGLGAVILTNKNHILEEARLSQVSKDLRGILDGQDPKPPSAGVHPMIWGLAGTLFILLAILIWLLLRMKKRNLKLYLTLPLSLVLFAMSAGIIPLFTRLTSSPWNSIRLFAPDIAYMTLGIVAILAWMGLVLMYGTLVNRRKHLESVTRRA
ncbi:serine hydrolase domain-containing protein [Paenibacillus sp. ISL-20]|uniref:serine hydrolase domain-containing protein n=2 Tax=unclassified Paenibacillus TaxID=185978 RepID=UPI001BE56D97|nr:serine hydrolase domain-containing protein [Paenibacillus sp. ISL-20]MBT2762270.1 beta-lactamase family protein [Paenibacillus sp. ISL-20]